MQVKFFVGQKYDRAAGKWIDPYNADTVINMDDPLVGVSPTHPDKK